MPAPSCASSLCGASFCAAFEAEVLHTVLAGRLLPPGAVVAVGASGKDSTVVAHVVRAGAAPGHLTAARGFRLGHQWLPGSGAGGRAEPGGALGTVAHRCGLRRPLRGWTVDPVVRSTTNSSRSRSCCTFCGVLQRRALEEGARHVGAIHTPTTENKAGHNADDMAETALMNFPRGDAGRLARGGDLGSPREGGALPRCRPLQFSQKEVVLCAHFRRLDCFSEKRVCAPEAFASTPGTRSSAWRRRGRRRCWTSCTRPIAWRWPQPRGPRARSRCGALASRALCQACALLDGLNRGRPRVAIGKGRRGLDEKATPGTPGDPARVPTSKAVPTF
uniref:Cytoplasmic tRNA 2-thiolation protein 1 C-terminal domain-containing protein n=1 Tax=Piliocolobus tephrosceles TaxID=591936 RepID=A0A8C9H4E9_9PRIM